MPGLPRLRRARAPGTTDRLRPQGLRLPRPGFAGCSRTPRPPAYFGKVPQWDGMVEWKKSSELKGNELDDVADFVASFASIPADMTPTDG